MEQVRHWRATIEPWHAVRAAIQRSQASVGEPGRELGINPQTIAKWRKRFSIEDQKTGPKEPRLTILTEGEEAIVVAFRRHTLLPLDDCLYALKPSIPHLSRSALHRCLQRHGISGLEDLDGDKPEREKFKRFPIGFFRCAVLRFISILPRCRRPKESCISLSALTEPASSLRPNWST